MAHRYLGLLAITISCLILFHTKHLEASKDHHKHHHDHHDKTIEVGKGTKPITLKVNKIEDNMDGWNIQIETVNFVFSPTNAGGKHVEGEGHAHLYINGKKEARLYGSWFHLSSKLLKKGKNKVTISLHANSHEQLTVNGNPLKKTFNLDLK